MVGAPEQDPDNQYRNRIVGMGMAEVDQLVANPKNHRIHSHSQEEAIDTVLDQVGWVSGIIVNRYTGFVVDGHGRILLAIQKGERTVPVQWVELTEEEEDIILASFDALGRMASTDAAKAKRLMEDVRSREGEKVQGLMADIAQRQALKLDGVGQLPELPRASANQPMQERPNIVNGPDGAKGRKGAPGEPPWDGDEEDEEDEDGDNGEWQPPNVLPIRGIQSLTIDLRQHPEAVDTLRALCDALALPTYDAAILDLLRRMRGKTAAVLGAIRRS
jgi:hypothetical protein